MDDARGRSYPMEYTEEELHHELLSREATLCTPLVVGACSRVRAS